MARLGRAQPIRAHLARPLVNFPPGPPARIVTQTLSRAVCRPAPPHPHLARPLVAPAPTGPPLPPGTFCLTTLRRSTRRPSPPIPHVARPVVPLLPVRVDIAVWVGTNQPRWQAFNQTPRWVVYAPAPSRWTQHTDSPAQSHWQIGAPLVSMISSASLEYVRIPVQVVIAGIVYNPTLDTVQFAFTSTMREPVPTDWVAGTWETTGQGTFFAMCLIGPGGVTQLNTGTYFVWVKVTDSPEVPVKQAGSITIYP